MRVFAAVPLPGAVQRRLAAAVDVLRDRSLGFVPVRPEAMHITLRFFGELDEQTVARLCTALENHPPGGEAFDVTIGGWGQFPPRGAPRVLFAALCEGARQVSTLHGEVCAILDPVVGDAERRPFHAHVTLARAKGRALRGGAGTGGAEAERMLTLCRHRLEKTREEIRVEAVHLYQSELGRRGPRYTVLHRSLLRPAAD